MRSLILAGITMVTAVAASPADAQRIGHMQQQPGGGMPVVLPPPPMIQQPGMPAHGMRPPMNGPAMNYPGPRPMHRAQWGGHSSGGHWQGGNNAPGGWKAYRRPSRGYVLPSYWVAPTFFISDYGRYGLATPPRGYNWTRYYDDAVLTDQRGRVWDSVDGLDWDRFDAQDGYGDNEYSEGGYSESYDASDEAERSSGYGAPYPEPRSDYHGDDRSVQHGYDGPPVVYAPPPPMRSGSYTTTYSTGGGYAPGGYVSGGYYYPPATTTVVTIQSEPSITTTTTEYVETTKYVAARRAYHAPKRKWHRPVRRRTCSCERPIQGS